MLPAAPATIPMEPEFLKFIANIFKRRDVEFQPDPMSDDLCLPPELRHFRLKLGKQLQCCLVLHHGYFLCAVHPLTRVASGLVTYWKRGRHLGSRQGELVYKELHPPVGMIPRIWRSVKRVQAMRLARDLALEDCGALLKRR
jgi:hypothetical protein